MSTEKSGKNRFFEILSAIRGKWYQFFCPSNYQEYAIVHTASRYDMTRAPSEQYYADIYLNFIRIDLQSHFGERKISILDAGCGQGRLSLPLAAAGHSVIGLDLSPDAIDNARSYTLKRGLEVEYIVSDLNNLDSEIKNRKFDCIICLEVLYMARDPWKIIRSFLNHLKKGGLLIVSLRTRYYYQLLAVSNKRMNDPVFDATKDGGIVNGLYFNWGTRKKWIAVCDSLGLDPKFCYGIGIFSGIPGDPFANICIPSNLSNSNRQNLKKIEISNAEENADYGRYIYLSATVR
ncbi:MAG: class I SAM-dependent methyltransferase [Methanoregula sp.]